ncbi:uncharacterized protein [Battus philenor]|uniref:uncharacterized protein n=1 Tax=Battus philenor TaxID=42288 RepID=UPI0035D044EA
MSFINIFKGPGKLFKKHVITFLLIRRYDLGMVDQRLRYVAVKPQASISKLRQKIWHLLDLPDYCDEIIVLKSNDETEIPLTALSSGNDPQHPYILEVWLPDDRSQLLSNVNNMLTMGDKESISEANQAHSMENMCEMKIQESGKSFDTHQNIAETTGVFENNNISNMLQADHKKSELSYKFSNTSFLFNLPRRNSVDNFTCILLKIQHDLSVLSNKLIQLEKKINV